MQKEIGTQMPRRKNMLKSVCEACHSVAANILEELYNSVSRRIADLTKAKGDATKY